MGYCDVHCHILSGIDDGAKDLNMSLEMIDIAAQNNITDIVLTPHYKIGRCEYNKDELINKVNDLKKEINSKYEGINLYTGTELMYSEDCIELLEQELILTMNDTKLLLVEFRPMDSAGYIKDCLYKMSCTGYVPVLAHVERYQSLIKAYDVIEDIIDRGAYIQVNASSMIGKYGLGIKKFIKMLMKYDMVHFVGTDAHNVKDRKPEMELCAKYIEKKFGSDYRDELLIKNPKNI